MELKTKRKLGVSRFTMHDKSGMRDGNGQLLSKVTKYGNCPRGDGSTCSLAKSNC